MADGRTTEDKLAMVLIELRYLREHMKDRDSRIDDIRDTLGKIEDAITAQNGRVRKNTERLVALETKQTLHAGLQTALTLLLSALATFLGVKH